MSVEKVRAQVTVSGLFGRSSNSRARYRADDPELHMTARALPYRAAT
jgi:hypothetical protein